jgi:hypothetical protein
MANQPVSKPRCLLQHSCIAIAAETNVRPCDYIPFAAGYANAALQRAPRTHCHRLRVHITSVAELRRTAIGLQYTKDL